MKVNKNLLQKLKEKNINLDIDKYQKQLKTKSNAPTQVSSSEVDSLDSSFMMQSINFTPGAATLNSNFRVRPLSAKREDSGDIMAQSQLGFSVTQNSFNKKDSQKTLINSQYQNIIDQRLNQKSSQNSRTTTSSSSTINAQESQGKKVQQSGSNIKMKTMTQSFYKEAPSVGSKKDNGQSSSIKAKPPLPNNDQNIMRQSSIRERKGSDDTMKVSMYKDSKQNKIREDLLNQSGEEEQFSDFIQGDNDEDFSENNSNQMLRSSSSQSKRKNSGFDGRDENNDDKEIGSQRENAFEGRNISNNKVTENSFRKSQSLNVGKARSSNSCEEETKSKQELDAILQQYDRTENYGDDSQNNSFNEELMIQVQQEFISESITQELIEKITDIKQENFEKIRRITLRHDCEQDSLQLLGEMCPNINELNINDSIATSLRDIGTSMRNLKILWISRVRLQDFSGFNAFPHLVELYASYNSIKNVSDLYFNENLEVLDLEGNDIVDDDQIEVLETLSKIKMLTLSSNPICKKDNFRQFIRQKIPQLILLDDIPIEQDSDKFSTKLVLKRRGFPTSANIQKQADSEEEEEDLYESIKKLRWNSELLLSEDVVRELDKELKQELNEEDLLLYSIKKTTNKATKKLTNDQNDSPSQRMMKNSNIFGQTMSNFNLAASNSRRPQTATTAKNNSSNINSQNPFAVKQHLPDSLSSLVEGTDQTFYGNPLKALKHKRKNDLVITKKNDNNDNNNSDNNNNQNEGSSMAIPKSIVNLLDQFKQETNDEGMNKLKEELKLYDFMVEQKINLQKKKSIGGDPYSSMNSQNGEGNPESASQSNKIVIKRPQIKLRTTSSQAQTKKLISDQQFNIQQQFKELQSKSRMPVKPTLLSQKIVENQNN